MKILTHRFKEIEGIILYGADERNSEKELILVYQDGWHFENYMLEKMIHILDLRDAID